ncbi:MAG TPA: DUF1801 domain-containing protein [Usitatibacteraceae bacterium]|jgi:hypothetical protein|nr:DUF1801 domain-containing protein [Usitatibacteraceae bacterium]
MAEPKTRPTKASVAGFLAAVADEQRRKDCRAVEKMMRKATGARPVMWGTSIVGFGAYTYTDARGKSNDWPIVGFSPRKTDLTLYLMPGFRGREALLAKLGKHRTGVACLYLKRLADVDTAVLEELIAQSVAEMASKRVDK